MSLAYLYNLPRNEVPSYTSETVDDLLWFTPATGTYNLWRATPHPQDVIIFDPDDKSEFCAQQTMDGCGQSLRSRPIPAVLVDDPAENRLADIVNYGPGPKVDSLLVHTPFGPLQETPALIEARPFDLPLVGRFAGNEIKEDIWWIRPGDRTDPLGEVVDTSEYVVDSSADLGAGSGTDIYLRPLVGLWAEKGSMLPDSQVIWYKEHGTDVRLAFQGADFQSVQEESLSPACLMNTLVNSIPLRGNFAPEDSESVFHMEIFWASPESGNHVLWRDTAAMWGLVNDDVCADPEIVQVMHTPFALASAKPFVGDFDGDGLDDIFWYTPNSTPDVIWLAIGEPGGPAVTSPIVDGTENPFAEEFDFTPIVGDFNGDLCDDILWFAPHRDYSDNTDIPTGGMDLVVAHAGASPLWRSICNDGFFAGFTAENEEPVFAPPDSYPVGYDPRTATRNADLAVLTP